MKFKVTPLNFATVFFIVLAFITWLYHPVGVTGRELAGWSGAIAILFFFFAFVVAFLDMIFRNFFLKLKVIWAIELSFIVLTVGIYLMVR
ncbi:hypothetical protein HH214_19910 [Mucilaginibacter robiniae]|uniref:Uncharacterized protein n=1 Tax=Mucilaginibacter robiniae TaxID=2728022 RepID=A0A7L5E3S3_9SPHI|nr:hypothetical protein [Mucilaginibacter robiniae]QJD97980.1 hypothetical protein HH214_19910 [Mucilaginibacter robiniae]